MRQQQGLTLIELLVALAMAAILTMVAVPSLNRLWTKTHLTARTNSLLGALQYARATAVRRGERVVVCGRTADNDCTDSTGLWSNGWLVFINRDGVFPPHVDNADTVLRLRQVQDQTPDLHSNRRYFEFTPRGTAVNGTLTLCPQRDDVAPRAVIVSITGRVRSATRSTQISDPACQT